MNDLGTALSSRARKRLPEALSRVAHGEEFERIELPLAPAATAKTVEGLRALHDLARGLEVEGLAVRRATAKTRSLGEQTIPVAVVLGRLEDLAILAGEPAVREFPALCEAVGARIPALRVFFEEHPLVAWERRGLWDDLVSALEWFRAHPESGLLPRAIPWSLHGKFFEENREILERLSSYVGIERVDGKSLEERLGLVRRKPSWRVRILDSSLAAGMPGRDLSMPLPDWERVFPAPERILLVENLETLLSLPDLPGTLGVWGRGHAVVEASPWIAKAGEAWYWGDLDAQGFEILDRLRREVPGVRSLGMDLAVLERFASLVCPGTPARPRELERLRAPEWAAYRRVVDGNLRLEQEKLPMVFVESLLQAVLDGGTK